MSSGTILHVNAVGLMADLEVANDRSLARRPFVIAREDVPRAVIQDLSPAAYREGIRRGMMVGYAQKLVHGLVIRPPRFDLYRAADARLWTLGMEFTPLVERAGRGHLFIDLTGTSRLFGMPEDAAGRLRRRIVEDLGIYPSLALASSKTVSKVATRVFRPSGFAVLMPHEETRLVRLQPVELLPGIGPVLKDRLKLLDIENIGELADLKPFEAEALGPRGMELTARAGGMDNSPVNPEPPEKRSIKVAQTFEPDTSDLEILRIHLRRLVAEAGFRMRKDNLGTMAIRLECAYTDGKEQSASETVKQVLVRDAELMPCVWKLMQRLASRRVRLRRLGLTFSHLSSAGPELDLFEPQESKSIRLQGVLDRVHDKYGFAALAPGVLLTAGGGLESFSIRMSAGAVSHGETEW